MRKYIFLTIVAIVWSNITIAQNELKIEQLNSRKEVKHGICELIVSYATSSNTYFNQRMDEHIREWVNSVVGNKTIEKFSSKKTGTAKKMKAYMDACSKVVAKSLGEEWEEFLENEDKSSYFHNVKQENSVRVELINDKPKYACFLVYKYGYYGGAHGEHYYMPVIIRKSDGKIMSNIFVESKVEELRDYLNDNLRKDDFGGVQMENMESAEEKAEFARVLREYDQFYNPSEAWIDDKNVYIQFQHYEIVPYAYGAPVIILPLDFAMPYLTDEVKSLLK